MTLSGQTKRGDMTSGNLDLFKMALGLEDPWKVTRTDFNPEGGRLDLYLDFPRGAAFLVPSRWLRAEGVSGARRRGQAVAPSRLLSARAYMHARLPRVRCHEHGVHQVNVSWARPGSGFTLLFEALLITFATAMPVAKVGEIAREHDTRVWRVIENHVARERAKPTSLRFAKSAWMRRLRQRVRTTSRSSWICCCAGCCLRSKAVMPAPSRHLRLIW